MKPFLAPLFFLAAGLMAAQALARSLTWDDDAARARMVSLGDVIREAAGGTTHIVYVHGFNTDSAGFSLKFQAAFCKAMAIECPAKPVYDDYPLLKDVERPRLAFLDQPIWTTESWSRSRPFVRR